MAKTKGIAAELLERVNQSLFALPVKPAKGQTEAAEFLTPAIKFAMKRGYTLDEIQGYITKEFGLTFQKSKMKKALAPNDDAQTDGALAKPKKEKKQKQTDTPPATTNNENGTADGNTVGHEADESKTELQTDTSMATEIAATSGTEIAEGKAENDDGDKSEEQTDSTTSTTDENAQNGEISLPVRVDLDCPKYQKDEAKDLGAKWDQSKFVWFVPAGMDLRPFEKWLKEPLEEYQRKAQLHTKVRPGSFEIIPDTPEGEL